MTKEEAILYVLKVLKSSMAITSKPTREEAHKAAEEHNITAIDLLNELQKLVWKI